VKSNKFSRALTHLKKDLSEAGPTNSMKSVYSDNRGGFRLGKMDPARVFLPAMDGSWPAGIPGTPGADEYIRPPGYWEEGPGTVAAIDWEQKFSADFSYDAQSENPRNTDTIIDPTTGTVLAPLPPGTRNFILGPLVDSYFHNHGSDNQTRIGYIQKDTRELIILARIDGTWGDDNFGNRIYADGFENNNNTRVWNGLESGFTAINSNFTFEHLLWFYEKLKTGAVQRNVSFFLAGGIGCVIGGGPPGQPPNSTQGNGAGGGPGPGGPPPNDAPPGQGPPTRGGPPDQNPPPDEGEPQDDPQSGDPPQPPVPLPPNRRRKKPGDPGYDPEVDGDDSNWNNDGTPVETEGGDDGGDDGGGGGEEEEPLTIDDFEKASDYSAYKAGGGDAARKNGLSLDDIIAQGKKNIDAYDGQRNDPRTSVNQPDTPLSSYEDRTGTNTPVPGYNYSQDIANSILSNQPVNIPQKHIPKSDIDKLLNSIDKNSIGNSIPVVSEPLPYSDDNFYEDPNGNVRAHTPETKIKYPNNTTAAMSGDTGFMGSGNPLGAAGQAQGQVVVPKDGSEPYFQYTDHAYVNSAAMGGGEIPDPIKTAIAVAVHAAAGHGEAPQMGPGGVPIPNFGLDTTTPNTGPMSNYPPNIRGDVRKSFQVPLSQLPQEIRDGITRELEYQKIGIGTPKNESRTISRSKRRRILREVKKPYVLPEVKKEKYKPNFSGKFRAQNTPDVTASKQSDDMIRAKNSDGQIWRTHDKYWAGYETTERMNVLQDRVGHGQWYFDSITSSNAQEYEKITERFKGALKDRDLQEHLNTLAHEKAMREMQSDYISPFREKKVVQEQETIQADNDPLMKKVIKRLRTEIDYPDKPSAAGYPNDPPPQLDPVTGMHPEYGKLGNRYNSLDPHSAETMSKAPTGDPEIDAKVQKARRLKSVKSVSKNASPKLETPLKKRTKKKT